MWVALALFVFALGLRLIGIGWGLKNDLHNQSYHPDEPIVFAAAQGVQPTQLKFTPGFYNYGTLYLTTLRVAQDVVTGYTGGPKENDEDSLWSWVSRVHMAGRVLSALAGAGIVVFLFLMLYRFVGLFGAVFGSLLAAVAPAMVVHSRFQTVDIPAAFLLTVSAWAALRLIPDRDGNAIDDREAMRMAIVSGLFAGLSAGTKYTGILALLTLWVALALGRRAFAVKGAAIGTAVAMAAFLVATPGILLDTEAFMRDFRYEMTHTSTGHGLVFTETPSGFIYHGANVIAGFGPLLAMLAVLGLGWGLWRREKWLIALAAFAVAYFVLIGRAEVKFLRYTFPLAIGMAAGFGYLMAEAQRRQGAGKFVVAFGIGAIGGIDLIGGMIGTARMTQWMTGEDPRDSAAKYLREQGTPVGLVSDPWFYTPPLWPNAGAPRPTPFAARLAEMQANSRPPAILAVSDTGEAYAFNTALIDQAPPRIAVSSFEYFDPGVRLQGRTGLEPTIQVQVDRAAEFLKRLGEEYEVERVFGADGIPIHDLEYIRPQVQIWKRKDGA